MITIKYNDLLEKDNRKNLIIWLVLCIFLLALYCGVLFVRALFFDGEMRVAVISTLAGLPLTTSTIIIFSIFRNAKNMQLFLIIATQLVFLSVGTYLKELNYYFFIMFLVLCVAMVLKSFKQLAISVFFTTIINLLAAIFLIPRLEWMDHFRFVVEFIFFLFGAIFFLIMTYSVEQKESKSEQSHTSFTSLLDNSPAYLLITNERGRVEYISHSLSEWLGISQPVYALNRPVLDLFHSNEMKRAFQEALESEEKTEKHYEFMLDGKKYWFMLRSSRIDGSAIARTIELTDVTPIMEAKNEAVEANEAKTAFLASISHEIRTPMNAILGISEIELDREDTSSERRDALLKIYNSGQTLLRIINDILDLSKIQTEKFELSPDEYDTASLINDTVQLNMMHIGSKPIEFILSVSEDLPMKLYGDGLRIKQILNNLLSNAIKYTEKGCVTLEIRTETKKDDQSGDIWLVLVVRDTGYGMTQEQIGKLFDEYSRFINTETNRFTEGTGLGMSITKNLAEMMNGQILVESELGTGSNFIVYLAQKSVGSSVLGKELAQNLQNFNFSGESKMKKTQFIREYMPYGSVLVVDDVDANLFVAKGLLRPYGLKIETVLSGYEALKKIRAGAVYDIVFMDHMMPGMDGIETTKLLREEGYTNTIVALTANATVGQAEVFLDNGFDDFISKPIDTRHLNAVLNKQIRDKQPPAVLEEARKQKENGKAAAPAALEETGSEEQSCSITLLKKIEGLEVDSALQTMSGFTDVYLDTVRLSKRLLPERIDRMDRYIETDMKSFTVEVHGLKSVLRNIGADALGNQAAQLESAALENNQSYCDGSYPVFKAALVKLRKSLDEALKHETVDTKKAGDISQLKQAVTEAKTATESFARDHALEIIAPYADFVYNKDIDELLKEIIYSLEAFDCEGALEKMILLEEVINGQAG